MTYRFDSRAAPRVYLLPVITLAFVAGSSVVLALGYVIIGLIALAASLYLGYHLTRYTFYQFRSNVTATDDEIVCFTSAGTENRLPWQSVTHGGTFETDKAGSYLFVYAEESDELLTIPPHYTNLADLQEKIAKRSGKFLKLKGHSEDEIGDTLKPLVDPSDAET
jgi:hypothetical protein